MDATKLLDALERALTARAEERAARENYDGVDWGYHGYEYAKARKDAEEDVEFALEDYVEFLIDRKLAED